MHVCMRVGGGLMLQHLKKEERKYDLPFRTQEIQFAYLPH